MGKVFGSDREFLKPRTAKQAANRLAVLARTVYESIGMNGEQTDYREALKMLCARERLAYDSVQIESALHRARGLRAR